MEPVENQVDDALEALRPVIPIRFDEVTVAVQVPSDHAGSAQSRIRQFGDPDSEEWQNDGSWIGVLTFPCGDAKRVLRPGERAHERRGRDANRQGRRRTTDAVNGQ